MQLEIEYVTEKFENVLTGKPQENQYRRVTSPDFPNLVVTLPRCAEDSHEAKSQAKALKTLERGGKSRTRPKELVGASFAGVSVPDEWVAEHGFGKINGTYYAGGRWKHNGVPKLRLWPGVKRAEIVQAYLAEAAGATLGRRFNDDHQWTWPTAKRYGFTIEKLAAASAQVAA